MAFKKKEPKSKDQNALDIYIILKSITQFKDADLIDHPEFEKVYSQYSINYFLMAHPTTVHLVMFASGSKMTNKMHYLFLLNCTDKEYIYFKREYVKKVKKDIQQQIDSICEYYQISQIKGKELIEEILTSDQVKIIDEIYNPIVSKKKPTRI